MEQEKKKDSQNSFNSNNQISTEDVKYVSFFLIETILFY